MSSANRNFYIPVSNGLLEKKHRDQMGSAIWLFLWLIDKCTSEEQDQDGWRGFVLGGSPITARYIAEQLGESERSVRRHLQKLEEHSYIVILSRTGEASSYAVRKSKKFHRSRSFLLEPELPGQGELRAKTSGMESFSPGQQCPAPRKDVSNPPDNVVRANKEYKTETIQRQKSSTRARRGWEQSENQVDPRRKEFIDILDQHLKGTIPDEEARPKIHPHATLPLDRFLKDYPKLNAAGFRRWLKHREDSDRVNFTEMPRAWIPKLSKYAGGPLDRYGKPKQEVPIKLHPVLERDDGHFAEEQRLKIELATADRAKGGMS